MLRVVADLSEEEVILGLAHRLFQEKDFLRAAKEYVRFCELFPDSSLREEALFQAGLSYMEARRWQEAAAQFERLEKAFPTSPFLPQALYSQGQCLKRMGQFSDARAVWSKAANKYPDSDWAQRAGIEIAMSKGEEGDYSGARRSLTEIAPDSRFYDSARLMAREMESMDQIPGKSPAAAGILSAILPGAGQFYLGRYRHGSVAFILNGLTIWGIAEALENGDDGVAAALLVVEAIWYSATIVGAISAAHKMNRQAERDYFLELERRYLFPRHDEPGRKGSGVELRLAF